MHHDAKHPKLPFEAEKCAPARAHAQRWRAPAAAFACAAACALRSAADFAAQRPRCANLHEEFGGTTQGVGVRGSVKRICH
jgi:hypothetical protein